MDHAPCDAFLAWIFILGKAKNPKDGITHAYDFQTLVHSDTIINIFSPPPKLLPKWVLYMFSVDLWPYVKATGYKL